MPAPRFLIALASFVLIPLLPAADEKLTGTWSIESWSLYGRPSEAKFRFLTFAENGSVSVSNGIETLPCWADFGQGKIQLLTTAGNVWQGEFGGLLLKADYQLNEQGQLHLLDMPPGQTASFTPATIAKADYSLIFNKVPAGSLEKIGAAARSATLQKSLIHLAHLGARFTSNELGQVTAVDLTQSSVTADDLDFITELPALKRLAVGSKTEAEKLSARFPDFEWGPPKQGFRRDWQARKESASGKAFDLGRRKRTALPALPSLGSTPPVFETVSSGTEGGAPAFLLPIRDSLFAIHPRFPEKLGLPTSMGHEKLARPVPLGKQILQPTEFQIRQFSGNPGAEWVFEPIPPDCSILYDGLHLKLCLPERQIDAYINVSKIDGNDQIVPGSPVEGSIIQGILLTNPDDKLTNLGGSPVIDARTGHLVGVATHTGDNLLHATFYLDPIHDLTRTPAAAASYTQKSFLNMGTVRLGSGQAAKLVGVLPPDVLSLKLGESQVSDYYQQRPNLLPLDRLEFLGREYLFSQLIVQNGSGPITTLNLTGKRVHLSDPRVRKITDFLLGLYGEPSGLFGSYPDDKSYRSISLIWNKPGAGLRLDLNHTRFGNTLEVTLTLDARDKPRLEVPFGAKPLEGNMSSRKLVGGFFDRLEKQDQEPKPRISNIEILRTILEEVSEN